jgi:hypothetical protein
MTANRDREHPYLGPLRYNAELNWWEGALPTAAVAIKVYLSLDECSDEEALLSTAEAVCRALASWRQRVEDFAVRELLPLKNESWLEEGEPEITPEEFRNRMSLESISFYPDGAFEFLHDDGELFWGHSIQVCGTVEEGPTDADIPG